MGIILLEIMMVMAAAAGSTMPETAPIQNAFPLLIPSLFIGKEIIAPSGKFWMAIPIDKAKADAIVQYRTENGPFSAVEDILQVSGIKDAVFSKIKDQITV